MLLLTGLNMRCSWKMLTHFTLVTISLQDMIVASCPIFKRLENIRIENQPFRTWTTDDITSRYVLAEMFFDKFVLTIFLTC